ncbi:protein madd-4 isoform X2 [Cephus cinctus]|uniref:Protein madd-4 isoform X2 n=1 Tax=Cephus cinctus TaxID=211228 RepID=A0AAJ7FNW4_CEPCN|nr:protein madd-4 isoform X2 [Cephus cinctus]
MSRLTGMLGILIRGKGSIGMTSSALFLLSWLLVNLVAGDNTTVGHSTEITGGSTSLQAEAAQAGRGEWLPWSKWSPCSRSCDGGVSRQQRHCRRTPCKGRPWSTRYKVCNTQPCERPSDFRAEQCAAFDNIPYSGQLLRWLPHHDPGKPCALICRGEQSLENGVDSGKSKEIQAERVLPLGVDGVSEFDSEETIVVQLADKVEDGTKCHPDSLDVCIAGECMKVGCDLRVGSSKRLDACGVCGGNGSSCQSEYSWILESISMCSKSCGGGFKIAVAVCKTIGTETIVENSNCDPDQKPGKTLLPCNTHPCSTKWVAGEWSECSASCGGGSRTRNVFCTEDKGNKTTDKLPEHKCNGLHRPRHQESCNTISCPMWETSHWSKCSVTCGTGVKTRTVECRDGTGRLSTDCDLGEHPRTEQECRTNNPCAVYDTDDFSLPLMHPYPAPPVPEKLIDQAVPSDSTFIVDEWSPCSVTCGEGIRHREVHCKIFLEFSRTIVKLPNHQCSGPKPIETERCEMEPCSILDNSLSYRMDTVGDSGYAESSMTDQYRSGSRGSGGESYEGSVKIAAGIATETTFSWREAGYTHCSATCLGGMQDLIINCVRDDNGRPVAPYLCSQETRPEARIKSCNDHPCPPRWNYSEFSACKSPCGIGIQLRDVNCIHEVTRGTVNTVIVPGHMCPQPPPSDRQYCNVFDCPVTWHVGQWGKCSKTCGGGVKSRTVTCQQVMAQGRKETLQERDCLSPKPASEKPCNTKSCDNMRSGAEPMIFSENTTYDQPESDKKKVDLKIGGIAKVFYGTSVVKIRCPVKNFDKSQIMWTKDGTILRKSSKHKISKKGLLRIFDITHADRGVYACNADSTKAETVLQVKVKHGEQMSSEEVLRYGNAVHQSQDANLESAISNSDENVHTDRAGSYQTASGYVRSFAFGNEDISHEARPEGSVPVKPTKKPRPKKPSSGLSHPDATMAHGEHTVTAQHQPGYHESVESSATSGTSTVLPYITRLISSLKSYWPFNDGGASSRGHRMISPILFDELRDEDKISSSRRNHLNYGNEDYDIMHRNPAGIPDEKFGPDEERIFIDDDPYDIDEAIFALQRKDSVKSTAEVVTERRMSAVPTKLAIDYIEESLRKTKRREEERRKEESVNDFIESHHDGVADNFNDELQSIRNPEHAVISAYYLRDPKKLEGRHEKMDSGLNIAKETKLEVRKRTESQLDPKPDVDADESPPEVNTSESTESSNSDDLVLPEMTNDKTSVKVEEELMGPNNSAVITDNNTSVSSSATEILQEEESISGKHQKPALSSKETNEYSKNVSREVHLDEILGDPGDQGIDTYYSQKISRDFESSKTWDALTSTALDHEDAMDDSSISPVILGKGTADDLIFEWVTTDWSKCSQTCGGGGFQMRGAQCTVRTSKTNSSSTVVSPKTVIGANLCEDAGYPVPQKVRPCGSGRCPQWSIGEWTPCESSRCFNWKTAMQRRDISCQLIDELEDGTQNVTVLDSSNCDDGIRPPQRQECYNGACKGVWRVGEWSECTASCEEDGIKYRILQCVWFGTKKPAGNACRDISRPSVMKTCKGPPCPQSPGECKDQSQLCSRVKLMNMCRVPLYQKQCCQSCR